MHRWHILLAAALMLLSAGCVTPGESRFEYREPPHALPENKIVLDRPFAEVWDQLIGGIAQSFFVINNVEKESRIINLSFSVRSPEDYIDCGQSHRTYSFRGQTQEYDYAVAASASYRMVATWGEFNNLPMDIAVVRKTRLSGRVNIFVAPRDDGKTIVSVNAHYEFAVDASASMDMYNAFGTVMHTKSQVSETSTVSCRTAEVGTAQWGTPPESEQVTCQATGLLESQILELASGAP